MTSTIRSCFWEMANYFKNLLLNFKITFLRNMQLKADQYKRD